MGLAVYLITFGIAAATAFFFFGHIVAGLCSIAGSHLRSRTASRRQILLERAAADELEVARKDAEGRRSQLDDEWERVESSSAPSSGNGEKASGQYEGVIGFFHPFWLVVSVFNTQT